MNYFSFHIGDYAVHTRYLSLMEDLAYRRLLDLYYTLEGPIPSLDPAREIGMAGYELDVAAVLRKFFVEIEGFWHSARCNEEIAKYLEAEPEREAKRENERDRQRRTRERRKELFDTLRAKGVVPAYDTPMSELQTLVSRVTSQPVPRDATATQVPVTNNQKEREPRATRLPAPFVLESEWREWAKAHRPDLDPDLTAAKFADYWHAKPTKDGRKLDWLATWRNWVREERPPKTTPIDVARQTVQAKPQSDSYLKEAPMTPEQRQAANKARELAVSAFKTIRSAA